MHKARLPDWDLAIGKGVVSVAKQTWDRWLRECLRAPSSPTRMPDSLGVLTGQDARALTAISACWELYSSSDDAGQQAALDAVRGLLPALQPQCRTFARELIAFSLDWSDRARLWPLVAE